MLRLLESFKKKQLLAGRDVSLFNPMVGKGTELTFLARFPLFPHILANISFVLVGVVELLEVGMGELALVMAAFPRFLVIRFALFCIVEDHVWSPPMVEGLMCIDAMVPIMLFGLVGTHGSLVPIDVEDQRVDRLQIILQPLLISILMIQVC